MLHKLLMKDVAEDELVLCAGLPLTGARPLTQQEQNLLRHRARRLLISIILWFAAIPTCFAFVALLWFGMSFILNDSDLLDNIVTVFAIVAVALGIPFSLFFADLALKRYRVLKQTLSFGTIRCFEGKLTDEDWTDKAHDVLRRSGLISDIPCISRIELHAASDVIYQVDGVKPEGWIAIELTRAASPPDSPARFIAPEEWQIPEAEDKVERRRLTPSEREEIFQYAGHIRRRRWLQVLATAWFLAVVMNLLTSKLLELGTSMKVTVWAIVSLTVCAILFYKQTLTAKLYDQDSDHGWALVMESKQASVISKGKHDLTGLIEVLPVSGALWMIGEKPAGWRRRLKKQ